MLGYVHNTTKIWRIWDFNSGRTGRAVECSSVVFQEEENAHTEEQKMEAIEFPDNADELHEEICEMDAVDPTSDLLRQENSKSNPSSVNWLEWAAGQTYLSKTQCNGQRAAGQKIDNTA